MSKLLDPLNKAIAKAFKEVTDQSHMEKYGKEAAAMIKKRTRLGYGVKDDGVNRDKLKKLADSTIESRGGIIGVSKKTGKRTVRQNKKRPSKLHTDTAPAKSNLTETGQLLDSLGIIGAAKQGEVSVGPSQSTRNDGSGLTNEDVGGFVTGAGRPFNNLSKVELKRINDMLKRELDRIVDRLTNLKIGGK